MKFRLAFLIACCHLTVSAQDWSSWTSIQNTNNALQYAKLEGSFKYKDCDGKENKEPFTMYLAKTGVDEAGGYCYLGDGSGVYDIKVEKVVK